MSSCFPRAPMDCGDGDTTLREELAGVLEPGRELEAVMRSKHRPNYVLQVISELIAQCQVPDWEKVSMDDNITQFHDSVGTCERLFKTPIPLAYTRLTSRVLSLWHLSLPFALWNSCGWLMIPVTFLSGAALFYIEEVGVLIEEPFWILALSSISHGVCSALDGIAAAHKQAFLLSFGSHSHHRHRSQQLQDQNHKDNYVVTISFDESPSTPRVGVSKHRKNLSNVLARVNSVC
jgi:putative membrane protein